MPVSDYSPAEGTIGISYKPHRYDVWIYKGDSFDFSMVFKDANGVVIDTTGWVLKSAWKDPANSNAVVAGTSNVNPVPAVSINTTNGGADGTISLSIPDTSGIAAGSYVWDLQINDGTRTRTYIGGQITVDSDITD